VRWLDWGPKVPMEYFALIRIALGLNFLGHALTKIGLGYLASGDVLARYLEGPLRSPFLDPPYRLVLEGVVVPNSATFSVLITLTEVVVGLGLILGLGTRLVAALALFLGLNYWLSGGIMGTSASLRSFWVIELVVLLAVPGVVWGLDRLLLGRAPGWLIGRPERFPLDRLHAVGPIAWARLSGFASQLNYLALMRIMIGFSFLVAGTIKVVFDAVLSDPRRIMGQIETYGKQGMRDPLSQAWMDVIGTNYFHFAPLVAAGELTAGLLLFLGLGTRVGALVGMWMNFNYLMMKGWLNNDAFNDRTWIVCQLVIFLTGAGLVAGLDGVLKHRLPRWLTGADADEGEAAPASGELSPTPAPSR
jgi:thiosulfate dehydrogenase [quinone] large subunit